MKSISLKLPDAMLLRLEQSAQRTQRPKSELVRDALERYLEDEQPAPPGSFLEAAAEWIGCIEGPGDLSYNPDHLKDFGR